MIPKQEFARLCALFAITVASNAAPALAYSAVDAPSADNKITALEVKLFSHSYSKDSDADRVARIERFVYGGTKNVGTVDDRVQALAGAVNIRNVGEAPYLPKKKPMTEWTPASQIGKLPTSSYPRVTDLEQRLFNQTYSDQPILVRINRLESKAFGRTSTSTDLAVRVDNLVSYVVPTAQVPSRRTPGNSSIASMSGTGGGNYRSNFFSLNRSADMSMSGASGTAGSYGAFGSSSSRATELASISRSEHNTVVDQIEYLESNTFGKIRPNKSLQKRVDALEAKIYGAPKADNDKDLSARVTQLWSAANSHRSSSMNNVTSNNNHSNANRTGA